MSKIEDTITKVKWFINNNPYPKYEEVVEILISIAREANCEYSRKSAFNMISEYGRPNHDWMQEIYNNIMDEQIIKENGKKINDRGDKLAMVNNYYVLLHIIDYKIHKLEVKCDATVDILYPMKTQVSQCWDGIGEWRH